MATASTENKLKLQSSDGDVFEVDGSMFKNSMLKDFVENECDTIIPLPNINSLTLQKIIEWATHHKDDPVLSLNGDDDNENRDQSIHPMSEWDEQFLQVDQSMLFELILAANYLDFRPLLSLTCKKVANMIRGKTPEEIRRMFDLKSGSSPSK